MQLTLNMDRLRLVMSKFSRKFHWRKLSFSILMKFFEFVGRCRTETVLQMKTFLFCHRQCIRIPSKRFSCIQNWSVACTPTQVSVKWVFDVRQSWCWIFTGADGRIERHDDAWRTVTTLRSKEIGYTLLNWMKCCFSRTDTLNRHNMTSIHRAKRRQTGINWTMLDCLSIQKVDWIYNHSACTTSSFTTPGFWTGQIELCKRKKINCLSIYQKKSSYEKTTLKFEPFHNKLNIR